MTARIVILTGAGISAESGIRTFRDADGLWEDHRIEDVATPEAFAAQPDVVHRFYNQRRRQLLGGIEPNAAHHALARLERELPGEVLLITQNIDDLHGRAGSKNLIHMHGELLKLRCEDCRDLTASNGDASVDSRCAQCDGSLRPHVVWFGEMPLQMDEIVQALGHCDLFAAIGTSGTVHPAAGFVQAARQSGAHTVEINLAPDVGYSLFSEVRQGIATEEVPRWVAEILAG